MNTEIISGKYTSATIFMTDDPNTNLDQYARSQLTMLCNNETLSGSRIRVMPDVHPGKLGTIGFTATVGNKLMPLLLGIDLGCGMTVAEIKKGKREWQKLDSVIRENIPSGSNIRRKPHGKSPEFDFGRLRCAPHIQKDRAALSLGTLGGGNHFIEVDSDDDGSLYLVIHTGSRHLGKELTDYYMNEGQKRLKNQGIDVPYELTHLEGTLLDDYLYDVAVAQDYAVLNRQIIIDEILKGMKWKAYRIWTCPHNYIDSRKNTINEFGAPILRKGAISAYAGEDMIIPANMRDGMIIATGLGNKEWNCSAPHGTGRVLKREDVKRSYTVSSFKTQMKGIYSSCVGAETLDEAPFAYRPMEDILAVINDTACVRHIATPLYNFKAGSKV